MSKKAIEISFPASELDAVAEVESYRKEVYRPIYHTHKWWAQRLGSVFRAIIIGTTCPEGIDIMPEFYRKHDANNLVVLDPFMGSGTTIGEALKLGCKAIGCDINPVSAFIVKQSLTNVNLVRLYQEFQELERKVKPRIQRFFLKKHPKTGEYCQVLYFFWVKVVKTPDGNEVPLFSDFVFSKNAYPSKKPEAKIVCPECYYIHNGRFDQTELFCHSCHTTFNPQQGYVKGTMVKDPKTNKEYKILSLVRAAEQKPEHKLYASMVLLPNGQKEYLPIDDEDLELFDEAKSEYAKKKVRLADFSLEPGHNTNQALNYNYKRWGDFFNERQLLCLGFLLEAILEIKDKDIREQFLTLFSGTLEFNNMFCSFKGEGTGAVRHLFNNHILKPERTPLENCVWGTSKSSGTFSTLFHSRLLKSKEYLQKPFELKITDKTSQKVFCNHPMKPKFVEGFDSLLTTDHACLLLNGDSSRLNIPDKTIDAVVTDPPYFDYVHYSELSDFFHAWLKPVLETEYSFFENQTSRRDGEVQNKSPQVFAEKLSHVFKECRRVLKDDGVMVFSFHHSKSEGWTCILEALWKAGFYIEKSYPIKAEMSVSSPKSQAHSPINLDALIVCKKLTPEKSIHLNGYMDEVKTLYLIQIEQLSKSKRLLSDNDKRVVFYSQLITVLSKSVVSPIKLVHEAEIDEVELVVEASM